MRRGDEQGAALIEFVLVAVVFLTLVFGVIESGWAFSQLVEVRNAAREGARLVVVDFDDAAPTVDEICDRAPLAGSNAVVSVELKPDVANAESAVVTVTQSYDSLTGFLDPVFDGINLDSSVEMRVERPITNWTAANPYTGACP